MLSMVKAGLAEQFQVAGQGDDLGLGDE